MKYKGLGIAIGYGSETAIPKCFKKIVEINGIQKELKLFDCPGFADT